MMDKIRMTSFPIDVTETQKNRGSGSGASALARCYRHYVESLRDLSRVPSLSTAPLRETQGFPEYKKNLEA
jgi:hypothetical protein